MLRFRAPLLRVFAPPLEPALLRDAVDVFRAPLLRAAFVPADFAREVPVFLAAPVLRFAVERDLVDLRPPLAFFAVLLRDDEELLPELALALPSIVHLPDMTRCAASATASAISDPSLVALAIMLLAAWDAVSAASRPASRMARRAFGLALIAAAAAASPAASISLLMAPLASLSTVLSRELEAEPEDDLEEVFRVDLAIARLRRFAAKDTLRP